MDHSSASAGAIRPDQQKQLVRFVSVAAKRALAELMFDEDSARRIIGRGDELNIAIKRAALTTFKQLSLDNPMIVEGSILTPVKSVKVQVRLKSSSVAEFYQTGPGLCVSDTLADLLDLSSLQRADSASESPYVALLLTGEASERDIRKELPKKHLSTPEDLANLLLAQWEGQAGFLLSNGEGNISYVAGKKGKEIVVYIYRHRTFRQWFINGWLREERDGYSHAGFQILCPGTPWYQMP